MNGLEFRAWRERFGLTQGDIADRFNVARATVQNWETLQDQLPSGAGALCEVWDRRLRQEDPLRGPLTLIYTNGPMFIDPYGPRRPLAMMQQETHVSNAAVLARVTMLAGRPEVHNPFVLEEGHHDLWNIVELQRAISGRDDGAPTIPNLLRRAAASLRADAPLFVRNGAKLATEAEINKRKAAISAVADDLDQIAHQPYAAILQNKAAVDRAFQGARALGITPRDRFVTGLAQAFGAARIPTNDFPNQVFA